MPVVPPSMPDDEFDEEEDERPRKGKKGKRGRRSEAEKEAERDPRNLVNALFFSGATILLLALAVVPWLPWISITQEKTETGKGTTRTELALNGFGQLSQKQADAVAANVQQMSVETRPEGMWFMIVAVVLGLLFAMGYGLAMTGLLGPEGTRTSATVFSLIGSATSIFMLVWLLAWLVKIVFLSGEIQQGFSEESTGAATYSVNWTTTPGLGIYIGLGLAVIGAYLLTNLSGRIASKSWVYVAELGGLVVGAAIVGLVVRSWDAKALWQGISAIVS
jgi:hypothetical protein